jgi:CHASE2 domain-containing sensor protein
MRLCPPAAPAHLDYPIVNPRTFDALRRSPLVACALAGFVWITGTTFMHLPLGDGLQRVGYDYLHIFSRPTPVDDVLVIAINEETDRKLGVPQNQSISRDMHSRLLERLTRAGAALVCYDILFDRSASEPRDDERFCDAIRANGRVILAACRT